LKKNIDFMTF